MALDFAEGDQHLPEDIAVGYRAWVETNEYVVLHVLPQGSRLALQRELFVALPVDDRSQRMPALDEEGQGKLVTSGQVQHLPVNMASELAVQVATTGWQDSMAGVIRALMQEFLHLEWTHADQADLREYAQEKCWQDALQAVHWRHQGCREILLHIAHI